MSKQPQRMSQAGPRQDSLPDIETDDASPSVEPDVETGESLPFADAGIENPEANDFERSQEDVPSDDPGDAQRASKSEPDGDGEEESR